MAYYHELPVYKASYDLLLGIFQFTKNFNKEYKYTVGESLKKETTELIITIYKTNATKEKEIWLNKAKEHVEVIRLLIRLMKDLKQISIKAFVQINDQIENVSKQLNGWQKSQKA
ncbi:MAG: four helix bundle protein [Sphingobacteriales bacterium]|nr:four helix bundle protein [Sphingobacteriales bacterium]